PAIELLFGGVLRRDRRGQRAQRDRGQQHVGLHRNPPPAARGIRLWWHGRHIAPDTPANANARRTGTRLRRRRRAGRPGSRPRPPARPLRPPPPAPPTATAPRR